MNIRSLSQRWTGGASCQALIIARPFISTMRNYFVIQEYLANADKRVNTWTNNYTFLAATAGVQGRRKVLESATAMASAGARAYVGSGGWPEWPVRLRHLCLYMYSRHNNPSSDYFRIFCQGGRSDISGWALPPLPFHPSLPLPSLFLLPPPSQEFLPILAGVRGYNPRKIYGNHRCR
jgi:hypothetical protein